MSAAIIVITLGDIVGLTVVVLCLLILALAWLYDRWTAFLARRLSRKTKNKEAQP
jgi:hypothetical protein